MYQDNASPEAGSESAVAPSDAPAQAQVEAPVESAEGAEHEAEQLAAADTRESAHLFREELARAMQAAADRERQRIETSVDAEATAHVEKVHSRAAAEAGELKRLAEQDVAGIRAWAKSEIERIRSEADVQIGSRRERLEQHLVAHATIIDGEIDRVSEAVEGYRHELDVFFARLAAERDPSEIARLADTVPLAPDFEVIRSVARADAVNRLSALEAAADEARPRQGSRRRPPSRSRSRKRPPPRPLPRWPCRWRPSSASPPPSRPLSSCRPPRAWAMSPTRSPSSWR